MSTDDVASNPGDTKDAASPGSPRRHLPGHKIGRLRKFRASKIDNWARRVEAATGSAPISIGGIFRTI